MFTFRHASLRLMVPRASKIQSRHFTVNRAALGRIAGPVNILAGAYLGGVLVCGASLYFLYYDADQRQNIPFELPFKTQITAVKAIGKEEVLRSPRYAVKHYRRLLIDLAKQSNPDLQFDETLPSGARNYVVPLLSLKDLVYGKSNAFANFYIDIVLRYAKTLLAKSEEQVAVSLLKTIIEDGEIFYKLGDAERMSQCCRLLGKLSGPEDRIHYLQRSINMLSSTFQNVGIDQEYLINEKSTVTDEVIACLNDLAASHALRALHGPRKQKDLALAQALNMYLANLKAVSAIHERLVSGQATQASYPLFDCDGLHLAILQAEIKSHVSEVLWARGYKQNAVAWSEEVLDDLYLEQGKSPEISPILIGTLDNLTTMYKRLKKPADLARCQNQRKEVVVFDDLDLSWYESMIRRFTKIIYYKGPLGVIEKALSERFGSPQRLPDIEEYEGEDEE